MEFVKSHFPKVYDSQWPIVGALFLNTIVQATTFGFCRWIKNDVELRMFFEQN